jgi:uroporphyrinogen decarboxylase
MGLFGDTRPKNYIPVWYMRQAGRYHQHYQNLKKDHDFTTLCKVPELATEVTMGPIEAFGFDAAILFSDILFPLDQLGMGLRYLDQGPQLGFLLKDGDHTSLATKLIEVQSPRDYFHFQKQALQLLGKRLSPEKTLIGFVGAPFTLYTYAMEGTHSGQLIATKKGLYPAQNAGPSLFEAFVEKLYPTLLQSMISQAEGGAQAMGIFDTAAGEISLFDFEKFVVPVIRRLTQDFKKRFPLCPIIYYSKLTHLPYLKALQDPHIDVLGIDWRVDIAAALNQLSEQYMIQGNIDPAWLHLSWSQLENNLQNFYSNLKKSAPSKSARWIMGLGHGITVKTPEENVLKSVQYIQKNFHPF